MPFQVQESLYEPGNHFDQQKAHRNLKSSFKYQKSLSTSQLRQFFVPLYDPFELKFEFVKFHAHRMVAPRAWEAFKINPGLGTAWDQLAMNLRLY